MSKLYRRICVLLGFLCFRGTFINFYFTAALVKCHMAVIIVYPYFDIADVDFARYHYGLNDPKEDKFKKKKKKMHKDEVRWHCQGRHTTLNSQIKSMIVFLVNAKLGVTGSQLQFFSVLESVVSFPRYICFVIAFPDLPFVLCLVKTAL